MSVKKELDVIRKALKTDGDYRYGWQANIAMSFFDESKRSGLKVGTKKLHEVCNKAADNFLKLLCA